MRTGSAIANGIRQYAVTVGTAWVQLESMEGNAVAADGLVTAPARRWRGQTNLGQNTYDYVQGLLIQNRHATNSLFVTTTNENTGSGAGARSTANAIAIAAGASIRLDNTDATKVYLQASGAGTIAAILAT